METGNCLTSSLVTTVAVLRMGAYLLVRHRYHIRVQPRVHQSYPPQDPEPPTGTKVQVCPRFLLEKILQLNLAGSLCPISQTCRRGLLPVSPNWLVLRRTKQLTALWL